MLCLGTFDGIQGLLRFVFVYFPLLFWRGEGEGGDTPPLRPIQNVVPWRQL
jgi:hypothetical protein